MKCNMKTSGTDLYSHLNNKYGASGRQLESTHDVSICWICCKTLPWVIYFYKTALESLKSINNLCRADKDHPAAYDLNPDKTLLDKFSICKVIKHIRPGQRVKQLGTTFSKVLIVNHDCVFSTTKKSPTTISNVYFEMQPSETTISNFYRLLQQSV